MPPLNKPSKILNLIVARPHAMKYIETYVKENSLGLGSLSEEDFRVAMDKILVAMFNAWADGFDAARNGR